MIRRLALTIVFALLALPLTVLAQHRHDSAPLALHGEHRLPYAAAGEDEEPAEPAKDETSKWDVNDPPGPAMSIPIDVREGSWMSLDVSPDGRQIVFDLLGDLYVVTDRAEARRRAITSGIAWDMQPRVQPGRSLDRVHQ
jgi:hypothetical protein